MENIRSLYCSYRPMIDLVGEQNIEEAFKTCYQSFLEFANKLGMTAKLTMDERMLMHAVCDAYVDIARLKDFHDIIHENGIKTLSYRCSWLLRRKPIRVVDAETEEQLVYINEKFVYYVIMSYLLKDEIDLRADNERTLALKNYCDTILYYLKYRACTPQILEIIILSFQAGSIYNSVLDKNND